MKNYNVKLKIFNPERLTDPQIIQKLCEQFGIRPTRAAGQNFLVDQSVARKMAAAAEIKEDDFVLEIGSGFGALTAVLARAAGQVLAVEKDPRIFAAAKKILEPYKNVQLVNEDILTISNFQFPISKQNQNSKFQILNSEYKLVANLPYNITSAVLRKFTEEEPKPELIVVMTQKEVAERVCAKPGEMSLLSVSVQFYATPEIIEIVPRKMFWPMPEVDSAVIKLKVHKVIKSGVNVQKFFQIVRIGFSSRRKQLQNNLAAGLRLPNDQVKGILAKAGFDPRVRAQDLGVEEWVKLTKLL